MPVIIVFQILVPVTSIFFLEAGVCFSFVLKRPRVAGCRHAGCPPEDGRLKVSPLTQIYHRDAPLLNRITITGWDAR